MRVLEPGTLWPAVVERTAQALRRGALQPIPTEREVIEQGGIAFVVRVVAGLERKEKARTAQGRAGANPFLPYDEDLFVAPVSDTHVCLLNRFNVLDHHLLVITRAFEDQKSPLTRRDFEALWTCMAEFDAFGFYNAGAIAGASQPHKHLQLVPVPLGAGPERTPIDPVLAAARFEGALGTAPGLPFVHALARIDARGDLPPAEAAAAVLGTYRELLRAAGVDRPPRPHNLLVTRDWMLLVPRARETWESISVNALGFAGALLVRSRDQLELVRRAGPLTVLRSVGVARD